MPAELHRHRQWTDHRLSDREPNRVWLPIPLGKFQRGVLSASDEVATSRMIRGPDGTGTFPPFTAGPHKSPHNPNISASRNPHRKGTNRFRLGSRSDTLLPQPSRRVPRKLLETNEDTRRAHGLRVWPAACNMSARQGKLPGLIRLQLTYWGKSSYLIHLRTQGNRYAVTGLADIDCAASEILIGCKMAFFAWRIRFSR
jgi:hypothetical protein